MTDVTLRMVGEDAGTEAMLKKVDASVKNVGETAAGVGKSSGGLGKLNMSFTEINSAMMIAKQVAGQVQQAWDATGGAALDYSMQVEKMQAITKTSVEETNSLIQVSDDARIEFGTLQTAMRSMMSNGIQPNITELAKLADEYVALDDPVKQAALSADVFGEKAGPEMSKLLAQGGAALRANADDARKYGGVTEQSMKSAKAFQEGLDKLEDAGSSLAITIGNVLVPAGVGLLDGWNNLIGGAELLADAINGTSAAEAGGAGFTGVLTTATEELTTATHGYVESSTLQYDAMRKVEQANTDAASAARDNALANQELFGAINTGLDSVIENWLSDLEWFQNGGLLLQQQFEAIKQAWSENPDDPDIERQMEDLYAKTQALKVMIGEVDATTAAENISSTLGVSLEEAKKILDQIKQELALGGTMNVDVNYNIPSTQGPPSNQPTPEASGGSFNLNGPQLFLAGEAGPERAVFIPQGKTLADVGAGDLAGGGGLSVGDINIYGVSDPKAVAMAVRKELDRRAEMASNGMAYGGR